MKNKPIGDVLNLGWFIAATICGFAYLGYRLDGYVESLKFPLFILLGSFLAFIIIGIKLYYLVKKLNEYDE